MRMGGLQIPIPASVERENFEICHSRFPSYVIAMARRWHAESPGKRTGVAPACAGTTPLSQREQSAQGGDYLRRALRTDVFTAVGGRSHISVSSLQVPVSHGVPKPTQVPDWQTSAAVQNSPSLHGVVFDRLV